MPICSVVRRTAAMSLVLLVVLVGRRAHAEGAPQVLDFCLMDPQVEQAKGGGYVKRRMVIFDVAGREVTEAPEPQLDAEGKVQARKQHVYAKARIHDHLRDVLMTSLPLRRFHNVMAATQSPSELQGETQITTARMVEAAGSDVFAAYSIACADMVVLPRVSERSVAWKREERTRTNEKGKQVKYTAWVSNPSFTLQADVFEHRGDHYARIHTLEGKLNAFSGLAMNQAASAKQGKGGGGEPLVSARPEPSCEIPGLSAVQRVTGALQSCGQSQLELMSTLHGEATAEAEVSVQLAVEAGSAADASEAPGAGDVLEAGEAPGDATLAGDSALQVDAAEAATIAATRDGEAAKDLAVDSAVNVVESVAPTELKRLAKRGDRAASAVQHMRAEGPDPSSIAELANATVLGNGSLIANTSLGPVVSQASETVQTCQGAVKTIASAAQELKSLAQAPSVDAIAGLAGCVGITMKVDLGNATAPGAGETKHPSCEPTKHDTKRGKKARVDSAICQSRVAADRTGLFLKKELKRAFAFKETLLTCDQAVQKKQEAYEADDLGVRLGKEEGLHRGTWFVEVDAQGRPTRRFARVNHVGPGGHAGVELPSTLTWKTTRADEGASVEERPMIGVVLGVEPRASYMLSTGDLGTTLAYGGALVGGYDASRFVAVSDEVWSRIYLGYQLGEVGDSYLTVSLAPEVTYYLGGRLAMFVGVAADFVFVTISKEDLADLGIAASDDASGFTMSASASLGFEIAMRPEWNLRIAGNYRQGFTDTSLEVDDVKVANAGKLSAASGGLSLAYTF